MHVQTGTSPLCSAFFRVFHTRAMRSIEFGVNTLSFVSYVNSVETTFYETLLFHFLIFESINVAGIRRVLVCCYYYYIGIKWVHDEKAKKLTTPRLYRTVNTLCAKAKQIFGRRIFLHLIGLDCVIEEGDTVLSFHWT